MSATETNRPARPALIIALRDAHTHREDTMLRQAIRRCGLDAYCYDVQGIIMVKGTDGWVALYRVATKWYVNGRQVRSLTALNREVNHATAAHRSSTMLASHRPIHHFVAA